MAFQSFSINRFPSTSRSTFHYLLSSPSWSPSMCIIIFSFSRVRRSLLCDAVFNEVWGLGYILYIVYYILLLYCRETHIRATATDKRQRQISQRKFESLKIMSAHFRFIIRTIVVCRVMNGDIPLHWIYILSHFVYFLYSVRFCSLLLEILSSCLFISPFRQSHNSFLVA